MNRHQIGERLVGESDLNESLDLVRAAFPDERGQATQVVGSDAIAVGSHQAAEIAGVVLFLLPIAEGRQYRGVL